jgi:hypothetical protein
MILFSVLMLAAQSAAAPALLATPVQATAPAAAPAKVKEKKICKTDDSDPGSRFAKRICLTAEEWAQGGRAPSEGSRSSTSMSGEAMQGH